jgi:NADPH:quinone reductase-like Zn-dependent oxidoreductase
MSESSMWAVQFERYGPPEVLTIAEARRPRPRRGQVVVRVVATSVNRVDLVYRAGTLRLHGVGFPKGTGFDFLGVVEASLDRQDVPVGQPVWGTLGIEPLRRRGAAAQYLTLRRGQYGVLRGLDVDPRLAALPLGGATALAALRDSLATGAGHRVLVVGGSGGVGTAAIQIARILGAQVDAVASKANLRLCEDLGAARTYDYESVTPDLIDERYDGVLVAAGPPLEYRHLVRSSGRMVCTAGDAWARAMVRTLPGRRPRMRMISVGPNPRDLEWLADQVRQGSLHPVVDTTYPVADIVSAHRDLASGHARGKRVVVHPEFQ